MERALGYKDGEMKVLLACLLPCGVCECRHRDALRASSSSPNEPTTHAGASAGASVSVSTAPHLMHRLVAYNYCVLFLELAFQV